MKLSLNGSFIMSTENEPDCSAFLPGSVYSNLIAADRMPDPYYRENELLALDIVRKDYDFTKTFQVDAALLSGDAVFLHLEALDTVADVFLNEHLILQATNMHRTYEPEVKKILREGENTLRIHFHSPLSYIEKKQSSDPLWSAQPGINGFTHIRKAHYMFGWDWGPKLPDMGLYREVYLTAFHAAKIKEVQLRQEHQPDSVLLHVDTTLLHYSEGVKTIRCALYDDTGMFLEEKLLTADALTSSCLCDFFITAPKLWWPNGYGDQPLYKVCITLLSKEELLDEREYSIGLRTLTVSQAPDAWGKEFCIQVNGEKIFTMGGDYIPEDNIIPNCTREKTALLLKQCREANFNCIRVWGGGYYPEDWFFDLCDEYGLVVWEDFMFACGVYRMDTEFTNEITAEVIDNLLRIRHHSCLGLLCGNNEMELAWLEWGIPQLPDLKQDYLQQFETLLPDLSARFAPDTFYWPSSPSNGGGFLDPNSPDTGDTHYWEVWHGLKPKEEFFRHYFRFCSEYGFESLPSMKTIESFTLPADRNLFSPVMELHQKCDIGNMKLLYYISESTPYPRDMEQLVYATQLIQAEAIRANVEHMRRNRGRCMGSVYWQLNDSNPVISWSGIDYYGRFKALHYYAARFYAPVLLSANTADPANVLFNVSNETRLPFSGAVSYALRNTLGDILLQETLDISLAPLSCQDLMVKDFSSLLNTLEAKRSCYLEYTLWENGHLLLHACSVFVPLKHFVFQDPEITVNCEEISSCVPMEKRFSLTLTAHSFAKAVFLEVATEDVRFSDNWFDLQPDVSCQITVSCQKNSSLTKESLLEQLHCMSAYSLQSEG